MDLPRILAIFLGLWLWSVSAMAGDGLAREDGVRLLDTCRLAKDVINGADMDPAARADAALCIGFVEGFLWGHGWKAWRTGEDMYFCPPEGFGYSQAVPALVSYLEAHPDRLIQRAHLLLFSALSSKFPCAN
ncbi:MAG: hypothetical protein JSU95_16905 [Betaproteobacteria bacterium]|nr:MAG: hypothetical protein JSU95_16905 [Betaproteobacteria bacterium]